MRHKRKTVYRDRNKELTFVRCLWYTFCFIFSILSFIPGVPSLQQLCLCTDPDDFFVSVYSVNFYSTLAPNHPTTKQQPRDFYILLSEINRPTVRHMDLIKLVIELCLTIWPLIWEFPLCPGMQQVVNLQWHRIGHVDRHLCQFFTVA